MTTTFLTAHKSHHPLQKPPTFTSSNPIFSHRLSTVRSFHPSSRAVHVSSSNDWTFEQRMEEAFNVLNLMEIQNMSPDPSLFCLLLQSCADAANLQTLKTLHQKIIDSNLQHDPFVANNLITAYSKCGSLESARRVFDEMPQRNIVSWTTVISMYSQMGSPHEALRLYNSMRSAGKIKPNAFTYTIVLNSCAKMGDLKMGVEVHEDVVRDGCESDGFVVTALIDMYAKCGRFEDARKVFDGMAEPTVEAYTAMMEGYNASGRGEEALGLVRKILQSSEGVKFVKEMGFACMIRSCVMEGALRQGQEIHAHLIKFRHRVGARTIAALVVLYEKCDKMAAARLLFDELLVKEVGLWGRLISGYVRNGLNQEALELYCEMVSADIELNPLVISSVLNACIGVLGLAEGKQIHSQSIKSGYWLYKSLVIDGLAKLYSRCGQVKEANKLMKCR
ncbi:Pentatricopeptide repeat [Cinnamomum micranthum f. kanehirae]|uniref:Pentatricopeptide repeat n=1 Tax=Cinnamomum micranthum f. kanehirae TaxID=337451 RepID=A0A443N5B7_9MAGN|nr:Pentatricopeptide repeat [Cinnamomum micranthum f. kanehirae]